ncbi:MAG: cobalt ECF transporter T component CbiQ [Candidatus Melainabacteria bacterium GWF2_32_7]|nr:MAG: cobalt ECF transporter T component CbiQ [Candidatus Melainabacteria bacterium GWF2_32_7]OGI21979.1 MAG: cobalt ECF transporter T component CbiQ [Candidatus Melainabacteria bacterium RIFOXYA2_FULL_32_9]
MIYIDKCAYTNRLTNIHPLEKLMFVALTMIICLTSSSIIIPVLIVLMMSFITIFKAGIPYKFYLKLMLIPLSFLFLGVISVTMNIIDNPDKALWSINMLGVHFGVTHQSIVYSAKLFLRSFGSVSCLYFLSLTTPLVDIISVLRKLKFPEIFLELVSLIYRLIFILVRIAGRIHTSQSSRLGYSTLKNQYRSLGHLISRLFILSYKKVNDLFVSLESRCYTGQLNVIEKQYKFSYRCISFIILIEASLIFLELLSRKII